jgi:hypothetical protein
MRRAGRRAGNDSCFTGTSASNWKRTIFDEDRNINAQADKDDDLPVLTEAVQVPDALPGKRSTQADHPSADELVKLESKLCAQSLTLADHMIHEACHDVEDIIVERVMTKLRSQLPALVSRVLHDHFGSKE